MKKCVIILSCLLACAVGCPKIYPITPNPEVITDTHMCMPACEKLRSLGCEEGEPVSTGEACPAGMGCKVGSCIDMTCQVTCEKFCSDTQDEGVWLAPACVANISKCEEIEECAIAP